MINILTVFISGCFLLAGCAHGPAVAPSAAPADASFHQSPEALPDPSAITDSPGPGRQSNEAAVPDEVFEEENPGYVADPIEPWNRAMFHFNDKLYFWILKPLAKGYRAVVPRLARTGVQNFFANLTAPVRFMGCLLQGKGDAAGGEFSRFFMNTTVGVLGFGNPAKDYPEMNPPEEDFGQTLGSYGIGNGFYIVWPFIGPSTLRDSIGRLGDSFLNPVSYVRPLEAYLGVRSFDTVNDTSFRIGDYESIKDAAITPYEAFRDAYIQHRKKKINE
ncbi:MAG: VacJ family lipoprotein [Thermodesulfobacteriota bacterium]